MYISLTCTYVTKKVNYYFGQDFPFCRCTADKQKHWFGQ